MGDAEIAKLITKHFDFTPGGMINHLELLRPIYKKTAAFGHFGRKEKEFSWEHTDKVKDLQKPL
jgi:S-adenosylmethionine synthetase